MPLSPQMRQTLLDRLTTIDAARAPVSLVGPDLRAETVEDAERLVERFTAWLNVFVELGEVSALEEDRAALHILHETFYKLVIDLETAIRATRDRGVPWEATRDLAAASPSFVATTTNKGDSQ